MILKKSAFFEHKNQITALKLALFSAA